MLDSLNARPGEGEGVWEIDPAGDWGPVLFGGMVLAQTVAAATRAAPGARRMHSLHAYFLRPVVPGTPLVVAVRVLKEGRAFATHRVEATQSGKPVLDATCSYTADVDADVYVYDLPPATPMPDRRDVEPDPDEGPWLVDWIGPTDPAPDGSRTSTHRHWFRWPDELPDDPHLHTALLAYASDWTGIGGRPLHLDGDTTGLVSLDHAVWFHRTTRADRWHLMDVHSLVNAGGRGLLRSTIRDEDGRVVVSMAQEMRITPWDVVRSPATSSPRS